MMSVQLTSSDEGSLGLFHLWGFLNPRRWRVLFQTDVLLGLVARFSSSCSVDSSSWLLISSCGGWFLSLSASSSVVRAFFFLCLLVSRTWLAIFKVSRVSGSAYVWTLSSSLR
ncbi:hypothetical protein INR49_012163, partial [Caranx melampygus]